jgi:hypothetical protein
VTSGTLRVARRIERVALDRSLASESANVTIPPWIRRRDSGQTRRPPRVIGASAEAAFEAGSDAACQRYDLEVSTE